MRDIFEEGLGPSPLDPDESVRRSSRGARLKRFYKEVTVGEGPEGFAVLLDGKPVKTPSRRPLAAPGRLIAEALAAEWAAQGEWVDPATMPVTRLANSIIEGVADQVEAVAADIAKFFETDLLFYRADGPDGLVKRQGTQWDPVLDWMRDELGARFMLAEGIRYVPQAEAATRAARAALPRDPWTVGALHSVTTLTGSALLALALLRGFRDADAIWQAAHVDEDWNFETWGRDEIALERRAARRAEFDAAALVLGAKG